MKSTLSLASEILGNVYTADYFSKVDNLAFHDLTDGKIMPPSTAGLLGHGSTFIPKPERSTGHKDLNAGLTRFRRDMYLKAFWAGGNLFEKEKEREDESNNRSKMYLKSEWWPDSAPSQVDSRLFKFVAEISDRFKSTRTVPNLRPNEKKILDDLRDDDMMVIALADKGLGPCAVTLEQYTTDALKHLDDDSTYEILDETTARSKLKEISDAISDWLDKYEPRKPSEKVRRDGSGSVSANDTKYLRFKLGESWNKDPFSYFYLLYKIHKEPLATRPVVSTCGCVSYGIAQWVDIMLQPMAKAQRSYFKDSRALKKLLDEMYIPLNVSVFSFDAVAMYSNICSTACLEVMTEYLRREDTMANFDYNPDALIEAISIVLRSNVMKFGDIFVRQITGVAMGINPAPPLATLFYALHEDVVFKKWKHCISFNRRFIDDGIAFWIHQPNQDVDDQCWKQFREDINDYHGLRWTFTPRAQSVDFMDMIIQIQDCRILTDLFEKKLALYLYIPPHSAHPPGVLTGLIMGQVLRIFSLCSRIEDVKRHIKNFHSRLIRRGYSHSDLLPIFEKAAKNAEAFLRKPEEVRLKEKRQKKEEDNKRILLHLKYHPDDPPSSVIQQVFRECILHPKGDEPFCELRNQTGQKIPLERLTVCYSTHPNLGKLLSYRKICQRKGLTVSSFLKKDD